MQRYLKTHTQPQATLYQCDEIIKMYKYKQVYLFWEIEIL